MSEAVGKLGSLFEGDGLIVIFIGVAVFIVIAALTLITPNDELGRRIKSITMPKAAKGSVIKNTRKMGPSAGSVSFMRDVVQRLNLVTGRQSSGLSERMMQAGWRSRDALVFYAFAQLCAPLVMAGVGAFLFFVVDLLHKPLIFDLAGVVVFAVIGALLPRLFVRNAISRRSGKLRKALPDALDLLVICSEAGLSLDAGINRVAHEFAGASRELAEELNIMSFELNLLPERHQAFDGLRKRIDLPAVHSLCSTLEQTEKFGTPLAQALRVLSAEQRQDRMMRAEEKAARLPAIMTVPMILFILPALFVVVIGPAILSIMDAFSKM